MCAIETGTEWQVLRDIDWESMRESRYFVFMLSTNPRSL